MQSLKKFDVIILTVILLVSIFSIVITTPSELNNNLKEVEEKKVKDDPLLSNSLERNERASKESTADEKRSRSDRAPFYHESRPELKKKISKKDDHSERPDREDIERTKVVNGSDYEEHTPIRIDNGSEFAKQAEKENWTGEGTEENPYIIEGYEINGTERGNALYIGNVSDHFTVKECYLHNASGKNDEYFRNTGLYLYNVSNGRIKNNTFLSNQNGMKLISTHNLTIIDNTVLSKIEEDGSPLGRSHEKFDRYGFGEENFKSKSRNGNRFEKDSQTPQSVIVKFDSDSKLKRYDGKKKQILTEKANSLSSSVDGSTSRVYPILDGAEIEVDEKRGVEETVRHLQNKPEVEYAEPNYRVHIQSEPNDPGFDSLWGIKDVKAPEAWNISKGSGEIVIGVVDTGVDYNHPDLKDNIWTGTNDEGEKVHGYNALNDSYYPLDDYGHGTHVSGTIGAVGNNSIGVTGMNWNVSVMPLKFLGSDGGGTTADAIACLEFALKKKKEGVNIVATSNSWGGGGKSRLLKEAIARQRDEDMLFVAAAGNSRENIDRNPSYPASYDLTNIVSVAATEQENYLATFSNYGNRSVHVAAPGVDINSTLPDGKYGKYDGTSMAAPHVSGLAGLLAAHNSTYDYKNLKNILLSSVDRYEKLENLIMTEGQINASKALKTSSDPDEINLRVHRPVVSLQANREAEIMVSLDDGLDPILGANVSVNMSSEQGKLHLKDDGNGTDQVAEDGYYTTSWTPEASGKMMLTIRAEVNGEIITENIKVEVWGDSGISLQSSKDVKVVSNNITNYDIGISLVSSSDNTLLNNNFSYDLLGTEIYESEENIMKENIYFRNVEGLFFEEAKNNSVKANFFKQNEFGVDLIYSTNNTLARNDFVAQFIGIQLIDSNKNSLVQNRLTDSFYGIALLRGKKNLLSGNRLNTSSETLQWLGMMSMNSNETIFQNNSIEGYLFGIDITGCKRSKVSDNTISDGEVGIRIYSSKDVLVTDNSLDRGILLYGEKLEQWVSHRIDTSNEVDGKPVYYLKNETSGKFTEDAGQVILANCTGMEVTNQKINGTYVALINGFSSYNNIYHNNLSNNRFGIALMNVENDIFSQNKISSCNGSAFSVTGSKENELKENTISKDSAGIALLNSNDNVVKDNILSDNRYEGIFLQDGKENTVKMNSIVNNSNGILLSGCSDNLIKNNTIRKNVESGIHLFEGEDNVIYHNSFIDNYQPDEPTPKIPHQARDTGENRWYKGKEGNYWSDYQNVYPNASKIEGETIWNKSYEIREGDNEDKYPLVEPMTPLVEIDNPADNEKTNESNVTVEWTDKYRFDSNPKYEIRADERPWINVGENTSHELTNLSDGVHTIEVRIIGQEKGSRDCREIMVDTALPEVQVIYPEEGEFSMDSFTVKWEGTSNGTDIEYYQVKLGENTSFRYENEKSHEFTDIEDGEYSLKVKAVDEAGNEDSKNKSIIIDTTPPEINITAPEGHGLYNEEDLRVKWNSTDNISGLDHFEVSIDGSSETVIENKNDSEFELKDMRHLVENLSDGKHSVEVKAVDMLDHATHDSLNFTIDTGKPDLKINNLTDGKQFDEDTVTFDWMGDDDNTGIDYYEIKIDNGDWKHIEDRTNNTFKNLEEGDHVVEIRAWDRAGNSRTESFSFEVKTPDTDGDDGILDWRILGALIGAMIVVLVGLYSVSGKKSTKFEDLKEDDIEISSERKAESEKEWKREEEFSSLYSDEDQ